MPDRSLWNWTLVIGAVLAIVGVVAARLIETLLPADVVPLVVAAFFTVCVLVMAVLMAIYMLRKN